MIEEIAVKNCISDTELFYKSSEGGLDVLCTASVYDILYTG